MNSFIAKNLVGALLLGGLLSSQSVRAAGPTGHVRSHSAMRFHTVHTARWFRKHHVHVILSYPVVTGMRNRQVESEINQLLRDAYPPGGLASYLREDPADPNPNEGVHLEGSSTVKLFHGPLMSVYYEGLDYLTRNGKFIGAYPNTLYASVTVDTRTGKVIHLRDLFHAPGWRKKLDSLIIREVRRTAPEVDAASVREAVAHHQYSFYLTPDKIDIFNIFDIHALSGIRVDLPRRELLGLLG